MVEIDFNSFELGRPNDVMIEFPTQTNFGLLLMTDGLKTTQSGWFRVVKTGKEVNKEWEGKEAFIYFHNQPIEFDSLVLASRKEQKEQMIEESKEANKIIKDIKPTWETEKKVGEKWLERAFAVINAHDVVLTREFQDV